MKKTNAGMMVFFILLAVSGEPLLRAHCQVPCGIYDDKARFKLLAAHITTMEKAMKKITALSGQSPVNYNQVVRWVMNKEKHAEEFSKILSYYFLVQRLVVKAAEEKEARIVCLVQLELTHRLIVHAMKAKHTVDLAHILELRDLLGRLQKATSPKNRDSLLVNGG